MNDDGATRPLPAGWRWTRLGDVVDFLDYLRVPVNVEERRRRTAVTPNSQLFPYYGANGQVGWIDDYLFDEELVLLAEDGGFFGAADKPIAYRVSGKCWVNNHAHVLRPKPGLDVDWLHLALRIRPDVGDMVTGSTRDKLNQKVASQIPLPLPPLSEQRRIAVRLLEQMAIVERARRAALAQVEAARALPASIVWRAFESDEAKQWPMARLDQICSIHPGQHILESDYNRAKVGVPYLTGPADFGGSQAVVTKWTEKPKAWCEVGDVLVTVKGAGVGKVNRAPPQRAAIGRQLMAVRPRADIDQRYLYHALTTRFSKLQSSALGSTVPGLGRDDIQALTIPFPSLARQRDINSELAQGMSRAESLRDAGQVHLEAINALPGALLEQVFGGFEPPAEGAVR